MQSGGIYGAWNDKNDPTQYHREKHAEQYYNSVRKRDKDKEIKIISDNTNFSVDDVEKIYNHIFINKYHLEGGFRNFDPNYDMAESWKRLRSGKEIQEHDIIMLKHEIYEYNLMNVEGLNYSQAHLETNKLYNYQKALIKWQLRKGDI